MITTYSDYFTDQEIREETLAQQAISYRGQPLITKLQIVTGNISDYKKLQHHHYVHQPPQFFTNIYKVIGKGPYRSLLPDPVAVTVYAMPLPDIKPRAEATNFFFKQTNSKSDRLKLVNKYIRYASRLVVDDRFLRLGIGTWLAKQTLPLQGVPIIETLTPIDDLRDMCEKIGFTQHPHPAPPYYSRLISSLFSAGIHPQLYNHPEQVDLRIDKLPFDDRNKLEYEITRFLTHFKNHYNQSPGPSRTKYLLRKLRYPEAYFIWFNPNMPFPPKKRGYISDKEENNSPL